MKKIAALTIILITYCSIFAQMPPAGGPGRANNGHVYGKITDSSGKPLGDVSVVLLQNRMDPASKKTKEVLLKGAVTKNNGEFNFEDLPVAGLLS